MSTRLPAGVVLGLTRDECRLLAFAEREIRRLYRREGLDNPTLRAVLGEIRDAAIGSPVGARSVADSLPIIARLDDSAHADGSGWLTTRATADRLEMSMRGVVHLLHEGRLCGRQRGANSAWQVSVQSVDEYRVDRSARPVREAM